MKVNEKNAYRESSFVNNWNNNRKDGIHGPKRVKTVDQSQFTCKFKFLVEQDLLNGFYVELGERSGHPYHHSHPKVFGPTRIPLPTRLLTSQQREETMHVVNETCSNASGLNFMKGKMGKFINAIKFIYLSNKTSGKHDSAKDDIELMIYDFESSDEISFVALSNVPMKESFPDLGEDTKDDTVTISSYKSSPGCVISKKIKDHADMSDLANKVAQERVERNLIITENLFIAVAWIVKPAFRLFMLCPEVVWIDVTSHSNNKGFHFLILSSKHPLKSKRYLCGYSFLINNTSASDGSSKKPYQPWFQNGYVTMCCFS
jgi:hypothetical protein